MCDCGYVRFSSPTDCTEEGSPIKLYNLILEHILKIFGGVLYVHVCMHVHMCIVIIIKEKRHAISEGGAAGMRKAEGRSE